MTVPPPAASRRWFLRRASRAALGTAAAGAGLSGLAACATSDLAAVPRPTAVPDASGQQRVVVFANWPGYTDESSTDPRRHPTLAEFTRQTGIRVEYSEPIKSDEEFLGRIGTSLAVGESTGYDLLVLSDWLLPQLIRLGWLEPLSPGAVPNAARLLPAFRDWPVPRIRRYSLVWQAGFTGIVYNVRHTGRPVRSMTDLLTSPDLRGRVSLVGDMRDVMGLVMLDQGINPGSFTDREFYTALAFLGRAVAAGQVRLVAEYYLSALASGTVAAGVGWAGDALYAQQYQHEPGIRFTWPRGGGMLWTDNMVIPALARHKANAERLMNFYYRPDVAAQLSAFELYLCPVAGAGDAARRLSPRLAAQQLVFPTEQLLRTGHKFKLLSPAQTATFTAAYESVVGL